MASFEEPPATTGTPPSGERKSAEEAPTNGSVDESTKEKPSAPPRKPLRFWLVFFSLLLPAFAANINATILSTVMPLIVRDIGAQSRYIWINASYQIACAAVPPTVGQLANIYGRRWPMLVSLVLFTLGSGICGGANGFGMLVAGRTVQGLGGGGIIMLMEVIVADLLPQRERPQYLGIILMATSVGVLLGPTVGGAVAKNASWRWAFYLNAPIGGAGLLLAVPFMKLKTPQHENWKKALGRIDIVGNILFIAATCSVLTGLVMGGQVYPWNSFHVIVPIVLGALGWLLFGFHQSLSYVKEPIMPLRIFSNRTAVTGYVLVFILHLLLEWIVYYLPYYFQTIKGSSPLYSSAQVLPFNIFLVPAAAINGGIMAKTGKYKPLHFVGFALLSLSMGLFSTLDSGTTAVKWAFWQLFAAYGLGCLIMSTLPAIQSSLPEKDVASSTGVHAFLRSFGFTWGFTIPSLIFNNQIKSNSHTISDAGTRSVIETGNAFAEGAAKWIATLREPAKGQVIQIYTIALRNIWYAALGFSLVGFVFVFVEKSLKLKEDLQTEYGLEDEKVKSGETDEKV